MNAASLDLAALAWTQVWQVTVVAVTLGLVARLACRQRPHLAYLLWMLVLVKSLAPPLLASPTGVFSWALRELPVPPAAVIAPPARELSAPEPDEAFTTAYPADDFHAPALAPRVADAPTASLPRHFPLGLVFPALWLAGGVALAAYVSSKWSALERRLRAGAIPASVELQEQVRDLAAKLGLGRVPTLIVSLGAPAPAVIGVWRPTVLLPASLLGKITKAELRAVLAHELVHVRRGDPLAARLQLVAQLVWWFHPLVWWANREARRERERACDEEVVTGIGCRPSDYARTLLSVLELQPRRQPALALPGVAMLDVTARRLEHLMRRSERFHRRTPAAYYAAALLALALALPGAGLKARENLAISEGDLAAAEGQNPASTSPAAQKPAAARPTPAQEKALARLRELGALVGYGDMPDGKVNVSVTVNESWKGTAADLAAVNQLDGLGQIFLFVNGRRPDLGVLADVRIRVEALFFSTASDGVLTRVKRLPKCRMIALEGDLTAAGCRRFAELAGDIESLQISTRSNGKAPEAKPRGVNDEALAELAKLHRLKNLLLLGAAITDAGLGHLAQLEKLKWLTLSDCPNIRGPGFANLEQLSGLKRLAVMNVPLVPESLDSIARLTQLESLIVQPFLFKPADVQRLAPLKQLKMLGVYGQQERNTKDAALGDAILHIAGQLANLRILSIGGMATSEQGLEDAVSARKLRVLSLYHTQVSDRSLELASRLDRLRQLELEGESTATDTGLAHVGRLRRLVRLSVSAPNVTDKGLEALAGLKALEKLRLPHSKITGTGLAALERLGIKNLALAHSAFNDEGCRHLAKLAKLEELNLADTKVTDRGLRELAKLANLRTLNVSDTAITDAGMAELKKFNRLHTLDLTSTKISPAGFKQLETALRGTRVVGRPGDLSGNRYVTGTFEHSLDLDDPDEEDGAAQEKPATKTPPKNDSSRSGTGRRADFGGYPNPERAGGSLAFSGRVIDVQDKRPIVSALVTVRRMLLAPFKRQLFGETSHTTDARGEYSFVVPPDQAADRYTYIQLDVEHPNYARKAGHGYALSMILKNLPLGEPPFFATVELEPAEKLTGRIITTDGAPVAQARVQAYSRPDNDPSDYGSFYRTTSGKDGRFQVNLVKGGNSVFWIVPDNYAPRQVFSGTMRGDWGDIEVEEGVRISGRVLDVDGKPLAGVWVNVTNRDAEQAINIPVATSARRSVKTDADGRFELAPLAVGEALLEIEELPKALGFYARAMQPVEMTAVFVPLPLKIEKSIKPVTVQAVPHVRFEAQYVDSKGAKFRGHEGNVWGKVGELFWFGTLRPNAQGRIAELLPRGLKDARLNVWTNEHHALRIRLKKERPLERNREMRLGTVTGDITGVEIVRYVAPIALVRPVDENGRGVPDAKIAAIYDGAKKDELEQPIKGIPTSVTFEKQPDGRFRSSQWLPDEKTTFIATAPGYQDAQQALSAVEGSVQEIKLVLKRAKPAT